MDAREILERRIDELCLENGRLRGQVARLTSRSIRTADKLDCLETENAKLLNRAQELEAENAKLRGARNVWQENDVKMRELLRDVYILHRNGLDCTECPWFDECNTTCGCSWLGIFANRLCELGILEREV
jgi:predicted nuclease with TOPRIM domain